MIEGFVYIRSTWHSGGGGGPFHHPYLTGLKKWFWLMSWQQMDAPYVHLLFIYMIK